MPEITLASADTAIKFLSESSDTYRLGGYGVIWGGADLSGEFFTKSTDFWFDRLTENPPVLYHHGLNPAAKSAVLGKVVSKRVDDIGLWIEAEIRKAAEYASAVLELAKKGVLGWSSGAVAHLVEKAMDGEIKSWPVAEWSTTVSPAEPRTLGVAILAADAAALQLSEVEPEAKAGRRFSSSNERTIRQAVAVILALLGDAVEPDTPAPSEGKTLPEEGADIAGALSRYADRLKVADTAALAEARKVLDSLGHALDRVAPDLALARRRAVPPDDLLALRADFDAFARRTAHIPGEGAHHA